MTKKLDPSALKKVKPPPQPSYYVARGHVDNLDSFEDKVDGLMRDGWKPIGGINLYGGIAYQAMVTDDNEEPASITVNPTV